MTGQDLRHQEYVCTAAASDCFSNQFLSFTFRIHFSRIDRVHAEIEIVS